MYEGRTDKNNNWKERVNFSRNFCAASGRGGVVLHDKIILSDELMMQMSSKADVSRVSPSSERMTKG